jgi:hypothetical protein
VQTERGATPTRYASGSLNQSTRLQVSGVVRVEQHHVTHQVLHSTKCMGLNSLGSSNPTRNLLAGSSNFSSPPLIPITNRRRDTQTSSVGAPAKPFSFHQLPSSHPSPRIDID